MLPSTISNFSLIIDRLVEEASSALLNGESLLLRKYQSLMHSLGSYEKKAYLYTFIRILSRRHLSCSGNNDTNEDSLQQRILNGVIALIAIFVKGIPQFQDSLVEWLTGTSADNVGQSHRLHRAVIAAVASDKGAYPIIQGTSSMLTQNRSNTSSTSTKFGAIWRQIVHQAHPYIASRR